MTNGGRCAAFSPSIPKVDESDGSENADDGSDIGRLNQQPSAVNTNDRHRRTSDIPLVSVHIVVYTLYRRKLCIVCLVRNNSSLEVLGIIPKFCSDSYR